MSGEYRTAARGDVPALGSLLVYHPANTYHDDHLATGAGGFVSISLGSAIEARSLDDGLPREPVAIGAARPQLLARSIVRELASDADPLALEALCLELLGGISRPAPQGRPGPWFRRACEALSEISDAAPSVGALAEALDIHPVYLTRSFRRMLGCTPGEYRRARRITVAAQLLTGSAKCLAEVALDCGFTDQSHMSRHFTRAYGISPGRYRALTRPAPSGAGGSTG